MLLFFRASYHFKDDLTSKEQIHNDDKEEKSLVLFFAHRRFISILQHFVSAFVDVMNARGLHLH